MNATTPRLHIVPGSPNCRKVQAVVHHLGLRVETVLVNFDAGEHKSPGYLERNPNGLVPTLVDGDFTLWESNAIVQYLADGARDDRLFPRAPKRRADVVRWQCWELAHFGRWLGVILFERLFKPLFGGTADDAVAAAALEQFAGFAATLDRQLAGRRFVTGDSLTIADYCLASQLPMTSLGRVDLTPYGNIVAWMERIDQQEAWRASAPPAEMLAALAKATGSD